MERLKSTDITGLLVVHSPGAIQELPSSMVWNFEQTAMPKKKHKVQSHLQFSLKKSNESIFRQIGLKQKQSPHFQLSWVLLKSGSFRNICLGTGCYLKGQETK